MSLRPNVRRIVSEVPAGTSPQRWRKHITPLQQLQLQVAEAIIWHIQSYWLHVYVCLYVHVHVYIYICICRCMCIEVYVYMCCASAFSLKRYFLSRLRLWHVVREAQLKIYAFLRLMIEILHDFMYQNTPNPRKYGSIVYIGSCKISIISRMAGHIPGSNDLY